MRGSARLWEHNDLVGKAPVTPRPLPGQLRFRAGTYPWGVRGAQELLLPQSELTLTPG